jgi:hypothetical protein
VSPDQFRAADPRAAFQVKMRVAHRTDALWMPVIREDLFTFEILQGIGIISRLYLVGLIRLRLKDRVALQKGKF